MKRIGLIIYKEYYKNIEKLFELFELLSIRMIFLVYLNFYTWINYARCRICIETINERYIILNGCLLYRIDSQQLQII